MIEFYSEEVSEIENKEELKSWISQIIQIENRKMGDISYIFCNDDYLLEINVKYLKHNYLTDVISFDYGMGSVISGDIFISVDRVQENAISFSKSYTDEVHRVMAHGLLHFCGYNDKSEKEIAVMREKEDYYLSLRTF